MNRFLKERLMRGDERRGDRRGNYGENDSARGRRGGNRNDYARGGNRGGSRGGNRGGSRGGYDRNYGGDMRYDDYEDYDDFEYNYDMHEEDLELSEKDIKKWEKGLMNEDGSRGPKFDKDQVIPVAERLGIKFDEFSKEEFILTVNMMYSDYCKALRDSNYPQYEKPEVYVNLAKAFLCDKDFEGEPYQKLAVYYYAVKEFDE